MGLTFFTASRLKLKGLIRLGSPAEFFSLKKSRIGTRLIPGEENQEGSVDAESK